jgi:hypothetical protein
MNDFGIKGVRYVSEQMVFDPMKRNNDFLLKTY